MPVTDGLVLLLDGDSLADAAGAVSVWGDESGSATQAETLRQPVAVADAINGHGVVRFDGVDDRLDLASNLFTPASLPRTIFTVFQSDDFRGHILGTGAPTAGALTSRGYGIGVAANKPFAKAHSTSGLWLLSADNVAQSGPQIVAASFTNAGAELRSGCTLSASATTPMPADFATASVGGTHDGVESFAGDIAEILVYDRLLTSEEHTQVWDYLAEKYTIATAAPVDADMDGTLDACDTGAVYLKSPDLTVTVEAPETLEAGSTPANIIDAASPTVFDRHTNSTHVWGKGTVTLLFDLQGVYQLETIHFWNYTTESFDVDSIEFNFYDSANELLSTMTVAPQTGFENILAEDFPLDVGGVRYVRANLTATNNEVEFQNIGFSGVLEGTSP